MWPRIDGLRTMELGTPGPLRDRLNHLTLIGQKHATAGITEDYSAEGESLETVGERLVLVDSDGRKVGVIEITAVETEPFPSVPWSFAEAEGEGFTSIEDWREQHRQYWREANQVEVADDTPVIMLHYRLIAVEPEARHPDP